MAIKSWKLPKPNKKLSAILAKECGVSEFVAEILVNRGISSFIQAEAFLSDEIEMESPFMIADMERAASRIHEAVDSFERIVIYGDYDCDGVTATVLLYSYLSSLGANVFYHIPHREKEGYGLNKDSVKQLSEEGTSLIITVDNGISAVEEIEYANELGMTAIITDHHQVGEVLPSAYAVVNPHRRDCPSSFKDLAGVGVAFKLVTAMEGGDYEYAFEQFADILAIGTVADVVPLVEENRLIVKSGLEAIKNSDNIGLVALMQTAGINTDKLSSQTIAFGIAPRINAAGRMEHAVLAAELLLCDDSDEAVKRAEEIEALNQKRKAQEDGILEDIHTIIAGHPSLLYDRVLTFYKEGWHAGIIGIVSSKVLEAYGKPNLLMTLEDGKLKGSARSVEYFSLFKALTACSEHLIQYGGHTQAAGFQLREDDFADFKQTLENYAKEYHRVMPGYTYLIDKEILPCEMTLDNIKSLEALEPFGANNQQPIFLVRNAKILKLAPVSEGRHLRLQMRFGNLDITAMYFGMSAGRFLYHEGAAVDFVSSISINYYNGREYLSVSIRDIRPSGFEEYRFFNAKTYYEMFRRGESLSAGVAARSLPTREETAMIYKYLRTGNGYHGDLEMLSTVFAAKGINYMKYRITLDVLEDVELIEMSPLMDRITMKESDGKVDLESADTIKKLKLCAAV